MLHENSEKYQHSQRQWNRTRDGEVIIQETENKETSFEIVNMLKTWS